MTRKNARRIGLFWHVAPDAQRENDIRIDVILQPGTPKMNVGDRACVRALEVISEDEIETRGIPACIDVQPAGYFRPLYEFDAVRFGTTWCGRVGGCVYFESQIQANVVRIVGWPPICGNRRYSGPGRVCANVKLPKLRALPPKHQRGPLRWHRIDGQPIGFRLCWRACLYWRISWVKTVIISFPLVSHYSWRLGIIELSDATGHLGLGVLPGTEVLLPEQIRPRTARDDDGTVRLRGHIVIDPEPKSRVEIDDVIQPRAPKMNVGDWPRVCTNEVVGQSPWTGVPDVVSAIRLRKLDELDDVRFRTSIRLGLSGLRSDNHEQYADY